MRLAQQTVAIVLSETGRKALQYAAVNLVDSPSVSLYVQDTDDLGMWVRVERQDGVHIVLVRWDFVLAVDILVGETKTVGLKP